MLTVELEAGQQKPNRWHMSTQHLDNALPDLNNFTSHCPGGFLFSQKLKD
jgi:hypothetical protein